MSRLAAAREDLDDDHAAAAARAGTWQQARLVRRGGLVVLRLDARRHTEQLAGAGDVGGAVAVGEQAVVTDAVEALGQPCIRNRRMNSCGASVIVFQRPGPSMR